ncbi:MAG: monofunctional biosynthetic peptidoglycan transglycosylase [Bacteroidetes bacterium]|nr:monofunctional biosynthetic peptidoglycan transglycosylase [Bacteroidota bacterium]MBU1680474.1 monofunctional biosynthetic peptidoglycan transglycosylase [Bacteroidota bacterium]MBU2507968.1 monofunctional biosynthetic peptidoglycan transglycosylase [Bacteroidota bacterium]
MNKQKILRVIKYVLLGFFLATIFPVILFRWVPLPFSSFIIQKHIKNIFSEKSVLVKNEWTSIENISKMMQISVIAAEDQAFKDHWGFDLKSIEDAIEKNKKRKRPRGASTITQQVAKNMFLWQDASIVRKGFEAYFTVLLELFWSKERILEVYLNIAEMGDGIYGVKAASQKYFKKKPSKISAREAAVLAAVLPNPKRYKVTTPSAYIFSRANWILKNMQQLGGTSYLDQL